MTTPSKNVIYEITAGNSRDDDRQLTALIPILTDWMIHHPNEPFDFERANVEFEQHRTDYLAQKQKTLSTKASQTKAEADALAEACREIAESRFNVLFDDGKEQKLVTFDTTITDPETKGKIAKVRDILKCGWVRGNLDPRRPEQRREYLAEIHRVFNDMHTHYTHIRELKQSFLVEHAPFKKHPSKTYGFDLRLQWRENIDL